MTKLITFEDLDEGAVFWGEEVVADTDAMVDYAKKYDPWPFHLDAEAAKQTAFGGLVASAGYTFSLWCRSVHTIIRTSDWNGLSLAAMTCASSCCSQSALVIASG
jgi:acyl dehydratase